jgi:formylglycine-generating enzyme required for sulfatase activity
MPGMQLGAALIMLAFSTTALAASGGDTWRDPHTGMEFVWIDKGCYLMGAMAAGPGPSKPHSAPHPPHTDEVPQHEVCVDGFWLGKHEVTQGQWAQVMGNTHPVQATNQPVAMVNWIKAGEFAQRMTGEAGRFRLPTEAEWEFACLSGTIAQPYDADDQRARDTLHEGAWVRESMETLHHPNPVGTKKANPWGLHDMLGNVWEWVADGYAKDAYTRHSLYNPINESTEVGHVIRGGSFRSLNSASRCGERNFAPADERLPMIGFRLVREADTAQ